MQRCRPVGVHHGDLAVLGVRLLRQCCGECLLGAESVGQTVEEATATLERAGFQVSVGDPVDSDKATNIVVEQSPSGQATAGATITISPSNGNGATVPDVTGQSPTEANAALVAAGFTTVEREGSCNAEDATVTATTPAANSAATKATPIRVSCK